MLKKQGICKPIQVLLLFMLFVLPALPACGEDRTEYTVIDLGDGLLPWETDFPVHPKELPENAQETGLKEIYASGLNEPEIYIYRYAEDGDMTLEELGQKKAAEHQVFCNMMKDRGQDAAVLNYYQPSGDSPSIVQAYIYQTENGFTEVCNLYPTEALPFGLDGLSFRMIQGYTAEMRSDRFPYEAVYRTDAERLPDVKVIQMSRDISAEALYHGGCIAEEEMERIAAYALDGWTKEEWIACYQDRYELKKGEIQKRNGLDMAFIGYIDAGIFKVRAFIDQGDDYILLCAEDEAADFQHITNALIDTVFQ